MTLLASSTSEIMNLDQLAKVVTQRFKETRRPLSAFTKQTGGEGAKGAIQTKLLSTDPL